MEAQGLSNGLWNQLTDRLSECGITTSDSQQNFFQPIIWFHPHNHPMEYTSQIHGILLYR